MARCHNCTISNSPFNRQKGCKYCFFLLFLAVRHSVALSGNRMYRTLMAFSLFVAIQMAIAVVVLMATILSRHGMD